jgi:hypothetical protein
MIVIIVSEPVADFYLAYQQITQQMAQQTELPIAVLIEPSELYGLGDLSQLDAMFTDPVQVPENNNVILGRRKRLPRPPSNCGLLAQSTHKKPTCVRYPSGFV